MQFALPPRRSPQPLPLARPRMSSYRRKQLKSGAVFAFAVFLILFIHHLYASPFYTSPFLSAAASTSTSGVVIVTLLDHQLFSDAYLKKIIANREHYANYHGYTNFFASVSDYDEAVGDAPQSWAVVPAVRHAMATHPHAAYFFYLAPHALIMDPTKSLKSHLLGKGRLEELMMRDVPIVPPDSIIKTFSHQTEEDVDLIITQDKEDLNPWSFVLKSGDFARFFLDIWFDPLYRNYNFAKAETHGLDHIMQWHPTVLARTAVVPQRLLASFSSGSPGASLDGTYEDGDFVVQFRGCDVDNSRDCAREVEPYYKLWEKKVQGD
ncbi:uncharacterized protein N7515_003647 [Penicillium bovifimosum]|uniref:Uncharacterized protein n=1 Tax=Penicillium bovifimosum TaxID=126998 RepID=A0A9W9H6F3_9EURO|nr:uncharacterized protein N7515_003647 [Penicillium bovifimosum]KAJ5138799.1 hypothetical protein N7515_003647 [Penicillium bovifimosum]